jgi:hypothetical protein
MKSCQANTRRIIAIALLIAQSIIVLTSLVFLAAHTVPD